MIAGNLTVTLFLTYLSFGIAVAGLIAQIYGPDARRKTLVVISIVLLVVLTGFGSYEAHMHGRRVDNTAGEVVRRLNNGLATLDELTEGVSQTNWNYLSEALDSLTDANRVGQRFLTVRDDYGHHFRVRGYYLVDNTRVRSSH